MGDWTSKKRQERAACPTPSKALSNGMAQPCADFIIKRIAKVMRMEAAGND